MEPAAATLRTMYQLLLTRLYLTSKIMPTLAALCLGGCTALVLIVWSVMGGFLTTLLESGRTFAGDVSITWPSGILYYDDLIARLEKDPQIAAATPVIDTLGVIKFPDDRVKAVQIKGIIGPSYAKVVGYDETLWWRPRPEPMPLDHDRTDPRLDESAADWQQVYQDGISLTQIDPKSGRAIAAAVVGIDASGFAARNTAGVYRPQHLARPRPDGRVETLLPYLHQYFVTISVVPMDTQGRLQAPVSKSLPVANEFRTGLFELDKQTVFVQFEELQRLMKMDGAPALRREPGAAFNPYKNLDPGGGVIPDEATEGQAPGRTSLVLVKAAPGLTAEQCREACIRIYRDFAAAHPDVPRSTQLEGNRFIQTWAMASAGLVNAVQNETALVLFLFCLITLVCSVLILAIFWAMISEKTKDIGILRAVGASRSGIAALWVLYGLLLGLVGNALGLAFAYFIVTNINEIHEWLGRTFNIVVWSPQTYLFASIPNKIVPSHAALVFIAGLGFAVLGAIVPAVRAALLKPVKALRFE
ncbi:hypothetical protein BH11PLA1_BH11PLA1_04270 [soil metagenome]